MRRYIVTAVIALLAISLPSAYGHGLGFDESPPVTISGRQVSVETTLSPFYIEGAQAGRPVFTVRAHDPATNSTIAGTDFRVVVNLQNKVLLDQRFTSPDGLVIANLVPDDIETAQVNGQPASGEQVQVSRDSPAEVRSGILADGGLYHVAVTLEKSSTGLQLEQDRKFDLYVSISKTQEFQVDTQQGTQKMSVKTYYADVEDFAYDPDDGRLSFSMPFDWSAQYVSQVQLVHMEVEFPKAVEKLQSNGYSGTVNSVALTPDAVLIDDYSFPDSRVVHFVLNNAKLAGIAEEATGQSMDFELVPASVPKFPLDLYSTTEKYDWQVAWGPEVMKTGALTTFAMNIQDPATTDLVRNASFDFVLEKDGREVYRQRLSSNQGIFSHQYTFAEPGTYTLAARNINGENESAQIDIVVLQGTTPAEQPQQPSGCLIATAAFGSELTPQVQFLRGFRDNYVMQSASGSAFMNAFNAVYYSFSPQVADYERDQPWLQATVKTAIYPLFGILLASEKAFAASGGGEAGTVLAGALASSLIGAVYVSPAAAAVAIAGKKRVSAKMLLAALLAVAACLAATAVSLQAGSFLALQLAASAFVVSAAGASALAVARLAGSVRTR
ncbi:MAG: CFI-box-CTERM domain-containing protein [Nitrososphaera sp.]